MSKSLFPCRNGGSFWIWFIRDVPDSASRYSFLLIKGFSIRALQTFFLNKSKTVLDINKILYSCKSSMPLWRKFVIFSRYNDDSWSTCGLLSDQQRIFCLLTKPFSQKLPHRWSWFFNKNPNHFQVIAQPNSRTYDASGGQAASVLASI